MVNPVEGKIVIEFSRKYASVFRCDGTGAVLDYDHFAYGTRLGRSEATSETVDLYARLYDHLNDRINGSARGGSPDAKNE